MTKIEWVRNEDGTRGKTWNPVTGCTKISPGCKNCYAERMAKRLAGRSGYPEAPHQFRVTNHPDKWGKPLTWKKPYRIFVCSMGDLFHDDVDELIIVNLFETMKWAKQHIFQVLTKRPARMQTVLDGMRPHYCARYPIFHPWPLPNVWLGVTAEDQVRADERIPILLQIPAAVRFVSAEPLLGPIDLRLMEWVAPPGTDEEFLFPAQYKPDWVIIGCETGPGRRPCKIEWIRDLVQQCKQARVACFVKALEIDGRITKKPAEWPEDLRVREFPSVA